MNTTPLDNAASPSGLNTKSAVSGKLHVIYLELRRAIHLSLEAYGHGIMPPV